MLCSRTVDQRQPEVCEEGRGRGGMLGAILWWVQTFGLGLAAGVS